MQKHFLKDKDGGGGSADVAINWAGGFHHAAADDASGFCYVCTLHPAPCTLHPAPCTLHPAPCTLHPAPCILHPASCTLHPASCTLHPAPCTLHPAPCTLHPAPCILHPASCILYPRPGCAPGRRGEAGTRTSLYLLNIHPPNPGPWTLTPDP